MAYTDIDKPSDYFNTLLYTGDNSNRSFTGVGFQPDLTWIKARNNTTWHLLYDAVRTAGTGKELHSNSTAAEGASNSSLYGYLSSFDSDGFSTVNGSSSSDALNETGKTYAAWNWKAGTSFNNDASATGIGSIDSTGSVNTTSGFSIITYTGTGSAATVAHGLGVAPKMIINRTISAAKNWITYHASLGATKFVELDTTNAAATSSDKFNNTEPTSTVFSIESSSQNNTSGGTCLAYCFAEKQGYSKFGSYTGNGNTDGTFVYLGFKPAFVIQKNASTGSTPWFLFDNKRNPFNKTDLKVNPNSSDAESAANEIDMLSNGFKVRTSGSYTNGSGNSVIYMAFAENPFTTSTGVCATAR